MVRIRFTYRPRRNGEITFYLLWLRHFKGKLVVNEVAKQHGVVFLVTHVGPDEVGNEPFKVWMVHVGEAVATAVPANKVRSLLHESPTYVEVVGPSEPPAAHRLRRLRHGVEPTSPQKFGSVVKRLVDRAAAAQVERTPLRIEEHRTIFHTANREESCNGKNDRRNHATG